jgi:hypothetical protein
LGKLLFAFGNTELNNKMALYATDQKVFVIKTVYTSGGFVLLWKDTNVQSSVFVLRHKETLPAGLLNSLKKQEVCV